MKTIALLRPAPTIRLGHIHAALLEEERALWRSYVAGELKEALYDLSLPGAVVLVLETPDAGGARALVRDPPLVRRRLLAPKLIHTRPYDGLANLFAADHGLAQSLPAERR